jgi:hypothetical protein
MNKFICDEKLTNAISIEIKLRIEEEERINNIQCPICKSIKKEHIIKYNSNDILGPKNHSWIDEDYYICINCKYVYKNLNETL